MFKKIIDTAINLNASDIHLSEGYYPFFRINQSLQKSDKLGIVNEDIVEDALKVLNIKNRKDYVDGVYSYKGYRLRYNILYSNGEVNITIRIIPKYIKKLYELLLPIEIEKLNKYDRGLVLITGKTCSGKSTTLASLINDINLNENKKIIIFEDPIEYVYPKENSLIVQKDISNNKDNLELLLQAVVRMDPDIIVVSEIRDKEVLKACIDLSEIGHLVFATIHSNSVSETITRIVDLFPSNDKNQIRYKLSIVLNAILHQKLFKTKDILVPIVELLVLDNSTRNIIKQGKDESFINDQIFFMMKENGSLAELEPIRRLVNEKIISKDDLFKLLSTRDIEKITNMNYN